MRQFKLQRTEGYARVNGVKVRKCFVSLVLDEALGTSVSGAKGWGELKRERELPKQPSPAFLPPPLRALDDPRFLARKEQTRVKEWREKVKRRLRLHITDQRADEALEAYASSRFGRDYEDLTFEDLVLLWHDIERREVLGAIYDRL